MNKADRWLEENGDIVDELMKKSPDELEAISIIFGEQDYETTKERMLATCTKLDDKQSATMFELLSIIKGGN